MAYQCAARARTNGKKIREHGTRAKYMSERCRCSRCRQAALAYSRQRARRIAYGGWTVFVDAEPVRAHVSTLKATGMGWRRVAETADVSTHVVSRLLYGDPYCGDEPTKRIRRETAVKLLAVRPTVLDGQTVDATGTKRRLQALIAIGWTQTYLAQQIGLHRPAMNRLLRNDLVLSCTARKAREVYDRLWDTRPPETTREERIAAQRARSKAVSQDWPPPMAWDDDTIDDPNATPNTSCAAKDAIDSIAVDLACVGRLPAGHRLRRGERDTAISRMDARRVPLSTIAERVRVTDRTVSRILAKSRDLPGNPQNNRVEAQS